MDMLTRLNSGDLHAKERQSRFDCVDNKGNIHANPERAQFVNWSNRMRGIYGDDVAKWPPIAREEFTRRYSNSR